MKIYKLLIFLLGVMHLSADYSYSLETIWNDYREPLKGSMKTCLDSTPHYVKVDLPESFLNKNDTIKLSLKFKSNTYNIGNKTTGFWKYSPTVKINSGFFSGFYKCHVTELPAEQTYIIDIDSGDFNIGENIIKLRFDNDGTRKGTCKGSCCALYYKELQFIQAEKSSTLVSFKSNPKGASIFLDNKYKGLTPTKFDIEKGSYNLAVKKDGYRSIEKQIIIDKQSDKFSFDLNNDGRKLTVSTKPDKAAIYIDGTYIGFTPKEIVINDGLHKFSFKKTGYKTLEIAQDINANTGSISRSLSKNNVKSKNKTSTNSIIFHQKNTTNSSKDIDNKSNNKNRAYIDNDNIIFGKYYCLVIGNNKYRYVKKLKTASIDANVVSNLLRDRYNFTTKLLIDATRKDILLALEGYRKILTAKDNFLIYYAGHGWLDEEAREGYWLPVDAAPDNMLNWISNSSITTTLRALKAKHVLVVADSCYAGTLSRGTIKFNPMDSTYLQKISRKKARSVLTSGGVEPVLDEGIYPDHSVFAKVFIDVLRENDAYLDATQLFSQIRRPVMLNSDQTPEFSDIRKAGHDGGDFIFVPKSKIN